MDRFKDIQISAVMTIEIPIPSGVSIGERTFIKDIPELRGLDIVGVASVNQDVAALTPSGATNYNDPNALYLTLVDGNFAFLQDLPFANLLAVQYYRPFVRFKPRKVSWERSFVTNSQTANAGETVTIQVAYLPK